jgi:single-stranded DNA-binding protein
MSEDFGIFAKDLRLKVTNNVRQAGKVIIIPCQMGFKQQDGSWVNEWVDLVVFQGGNYTPAMSVIKGETITVNGRMVMKSWNDKKSWNILCDDLLVPNAGVTQSGGSQDSDVPF